ncbi:hypothetical protein JYU34_004020 [Plutella xylostella]|uniref:FLYWCH-type domain-containing protein n=1 Tax=Plutella xylostella TaxID=51655 RepID=A0ABQ7QX15_PLUXY|nr:hypothetical protein JYU34_004020 [Plutella xylostella]
MQHNAFFFSISNEGKHKILLLFLRSGISYVKHRSSGTVLCKKVLKMSDQRIVQTFKSNKNGIKLYVDGFSFEKNKVVGERYYWRCENKSDKLYNCNATAVSKLNEENNDEHIVLSIKQTHNHEPNVLRLTLAETKTTLKEKCSDIAKKPVTS